MILTADTNVLVRALTLDDERQGEIATLELEQADGVALPLVTLCELVWVLRRGYGVGVQDVATALRRLIDGAGVLVDRSAVAAGLAVMEAGGDFADGVIEHDGRRLGAELFLTFDKGAAAILLAQGRRARLLA